MQVTQNALSLLDAAGLSHIGVFLWAKSFKSNCSDVACNWAQDILH